MLRKKLSERDKGKYGKVLKKAYNEHDEGFAVHMDRQAKGKAG